MRMLDLAPEEVWRRRRGHIREWERMLGDEGTTLVKVFLNVSKDEQRSALPGAGRRSGEALEVPAGDLDVRERYDDYLTAWEEVDRTRPPPNGPPGTSFPRTGTGSRAPRSRHSSSTRSSGSIRSCPSPRPESRDW